MNERHLYCFWTGANEMTPTRLRNLQLLKDHSDANVILVTPETLGDYIVPGHPLHEAYPYLSAVHRADYLRVYFMHHIGGGYSDIKRPGGSWSKAFDDMDEHTWVNGYQEVHPDHIGYTPHCGLWQTLIGNGSFIFRPHTPLSEMFYNEVHMLLDAKLPELKRHPATSPRDHAGSGSGYPIEWNEMLGRIFHRIQPMFLAHMKTSVPYPVCDDYQ